MIIKRKVNDGPWEEIEVEFGVMETMKNGTKTRKKNACIVHRLPVPDITTAVAPIAWERILKEMWD